LLLYRVGFAFFCADLNESPTDDATDASTSSPQKRRLVIDTAHESSGTSTEVMGSSTSEMEIASDWTEFASLSSSRKLQETSRATQVSRPAIYSLWKFLLQILKKRRRLLSELNLWLSVYF